MGVAGLEQNRYTAEIIELALHTLVLWAGNCDQTSRVLADQGIDVGPRTLLRWRKTIHRERYDELQKEYAPRLEQMVATRTRELALAASDASLHAVHQARYDLAKGKVPDAAAAGRNLATIAGIATDKLLAITGRPSVIVQHRSAQEVLEQVERENPDLVIDADHEEIPDAEVIPPPPGHDLSTESVGANALVPVDD